MLVNCTCSLKTFIVVHMKFCTRVKLGACCFEYMYVRTLSCMHVVFFSRIIVV